jgi:hypothetical protein
LDHQKSTRKAAIQFFLSKASPRGAPIAPLLELWPGSRGGQGVAPWTECPAERIYAEGASAHWDHERILRGVGYGGGVHPEVGDN